MVKGIGSYPEYNISNAGLKSENVQNAISQSKQAVADNFESNSAVQTVAGNTSDPDVMRNSLLILPPLAILNKFVENKIAGTEGSSLLTKAANLGDKISHKLHLDKLISSDTSSRISNFIKNNRFTKYFTNAYKAVPKSTFAKGSTLTEKYSQELTSALKTFASAHSAEGAMDTLSTKLSESTVNLLKGFTNPENASTAKLSVENLLNAADDLVSNGFVKMEEGGIFPKTTDISGIRNKLKAANMQVGKTGLGKIFSKGLLKSKDAITFGGGLMGLFFTANSIIQAVKAAKEAPKGEKKATFMHVLSEHYIGLLLFQPSVNMLYKAGGNKYRGMSIEGRNALKELIQKANQANANGSLTKEAYKIAKMQKKLLLKGVSHEKVADLAGKSLQEAKGIFNSLKNSGAKLKFWERPLKFLGNLLDSGLDSIKNPSAAGKAAGKVKGFLGGFGRLLIILLVLQPILQKPVTKLCHKIFGEPKTYMEKQRKKSSSNNDNSNVQTTTPEVIDATGKPETNLLKIFDINKQQEKASAEQVQQTQPQVNVSVNQPVVQPQSASQEEIPLLHISKDDKSNDKKSGYKGYIPSIQVDNSGQLQREKELEKYVDNFIKQKDNELKQVSKK